MNRRLKKLNQELGLTDTDHMISKNKILDKVNAAINCDLSERQIYMKQRFTKVALIAAIIALLGTTTVFAAINSGFLSTFFKGDTKQLDAYVNTPSETVADENYRFTLEQVLTTKCQALVIYSIEGLSDEAKVLINGRNENGWSTFFDMDTISFGPLDSESVEFTGWGQGEIMERKGENKLYMALTCVNMVNENEEDFYIRFNNMENAKNIVIPMKSNVETKEFILKGQPCGEATLQCTPIGMSFERGYPLGRVDLFKHTQLYFRMKDGSIKTFNEMCNIESGTRMDDNDFAKYGRWKTKGLTHEIVDLNDFKSIILGDIEYDANDLSKTKPFAADGYLLPFEVKPYYKEHLWLPIEEFCKKAGANMKWNTDKSSVEVTYRGSIYVFKAGTTKVIKDGNEIDYEDKDNDNTTFLDESGRLLVTPNILEHMRVTVEVENLMDETGKDTDVRDWMYTINP